MSDPREPVPGGDPPDLTVTVTRSGGFAGLTLRWTADTAGLDGPAARTLRDLVARIDLDALASRSAPRRGIPDAFTYDVEVTDGTRTWHATVPERDAPPPLQALLTHLRTPRGDQGTRGDQGIRGDHDA